MVPKRLLETEAGLSERLLRAGLSVSEPPAHALSRTLASVGLSAQLSPDVVGEPTPPEVSAATSGVAQLSALGISKYVLGGMVGGVLLSAVAVAITAPDAGSKAPADHAATARAAAAAVGSSSALPSVQLSEQVPTPRVASAQKSSGSSPSAGPTATESAESSLADEVKLLDRASAALASGSTSGCLKLLNEYRWRFAGGQLELEAGLLRVRAEHAAGNQQRARQLAEELLARSGTGAFAARVRAAAGLSPAREKSDAGPIKP